MQAAVIPPLPPVTAAQLRVLFDERVSVFEPVNPSDTYYSISQLDFLGQGVINIAITTHLFDKAVTAGSDIAEFSESRDNYASVTTMAVWADLYTKFAGEDSPSDKARLFSAYVGALYCQEGLQVPRDWISELIQYSDAVHPGGLAINLDTTTPATAPSSSELSLPSRKRKLMPDMIPSPSPSSSKQKSNDYPINAPTSIPSSSTPPASSNILNTPIKTKRKETVVPGGKKFLSVLNDNCIPRKLTPAWAVECFGPPHQLEWKATLSSKELLFTPQPISLTPIPEVSDSGVSATGYANSKQAAREEAARLLCEKAGWN
ncbi:hypothetical protein FRB99_008641 [Tulasnella sp. 403]|nr:hypothetical protein FRB99_008641 [Tulasnella sp. 403]